MAKYKSRKHNKSICVKGVECAIENDVLIIKKGSLSKDFVIPEYMEALIKEKKLSFKTKESYGKSAESSLNKHERAMWGTVVALVSNCIKGFTKGFKKILYLKGVGFRGSISGDKITLKVGFSHTTDVLISKETKVKLEECKRDPTALGDYRITVEGYDKQSVGDMADKIRRVRPYNPCLCNGIVYSTEVLIKKAGAKK